MRVKNLFGPGWERPLKKILRDPDRAMTDYFMRVHAGKPMRAILAITSQNLSNSGNVV
jgi:hypothetical protein